MVFRNTTLSMGTSFDDFKYFFSKCTFDLPVVHVWSGRSTKSGKLSAQQNKGFPVFSFFLEREIAIPWCCIMTDYLGLTFVFSGVIEMEEEQLERKTIFGFRDSKQNNADSDSDDE